MELPIFVKYINGTQQTYFEKFFLPLKELVTMSRPASISVLWSFHFTMAKCIASSNYISFSDSAKV